MPFWSTASTADTTDTQAQLANAQRRLNQARRRLLGGCILLAIALIVLPFVLDRQARPWSDDVVLRLYKGQGPFHGPATSNVPTKPGLALPEPAPEVSPATEAKP